LTVITVSTAIFRDVARTPPPIPRRGLAPYSHREGRIKILRADIYLYSAGENYWFSPIASLNQEAEDRAKALSAAEVETDIITLIRAEERHPTSSNTGGRGSGATATGSLSSRLTSRHSKTSRTSCARKWRGPRSSETRGLLQLPPAQEDDAKKKLADQETGAANAVRRGWKHLLLPQEPQPGSPNEARGFDLEPVALTNRAHDPEPLAQLAWKKCEADGLIVSRLGVLDNDLGKVWQPHQPHVSVKQLRDWFVQYPYQAA
jgi:hypothetical protein